MPRLSPRNLLTSTALRAGPRCCSCDSGTPATPNARAVRRFLREFLSDPPLVEIARACHLKNDLVRARAPISSAQDSGQVRGDLVGAGLAADGLPIQPAAGVAAAGDPWATAGLTSKSRLRCATASRGVRPLPSCDKGWSIGCLCCRCIHSIRRRRPPCSTAIAERVQTMRNVPEIRWVKHFHDHRVHEGERSVLDHWSRFACFPPGDKLDHQFPWCETITGSW